MNRKPNMDKTVDMEAERQNERKELQYSTVAEYINRYEGEVKERMLRLRRMILEASPEITEKISWGMATFVLKGNLIHFAGEKNHIGLHPGPEAVLYVKDRLEGYKFSKGTIQLPHNKPVPYDLVSDIIEYCVKQRSNK